MARDPICGMTVDEKTARSAVRDGVTFYFCAEGCRRTFMGDGYVPAPFKIHINNAGITKNYGR